MADHDEVMGVPLRTDGGEALAAVVDAAVAAGDWATALAVLRENVVQLVTERFRWVQELLAAIPAEQELDPLLRLVRGFVLGTPDRAALERGDALDQPVEIRVVAAFMRVVGLRWTGRLDEAEEIVRATLPLMTTAELPAMNDRLALVRLHFGILRLLRGELEAAIEDLRATHAMAFHARSAFVARNAAGDLALAHALRGELPQAEGWLEVFESTGFDPHGQFERTVRVGGLVARCLVALDRMRLEQADEALRGLEHLTPSEELWVFVAVVRALHANARGDGAAGLRVLEQAETAHRGTTAGVGLAPRLIAAVRADLLLAVGQGTRARALLDGLDDRSDLVELRRARVALVTGDPATAVPLADAIVWGTRASVRTRVDAHVVAAVGRWRLAERGHERVDTLRARAHELLADAVRIAVPAGQLSPFVLAERAELLAIAAHGTEGAGVREVLDIPELVGVGPLLPPRLTVTPLTERELAVLSELETTRSLEVVARRLFVSPNTVKTQVRTIYRKLGVHSREEALSEAYRQGFLAR